MHDGRNAPGAYEERTCEGDVGLDPALVDEGPMFTLGPVAPPETTVLPETLYVPLEGGFSLSGGATVLNPIVATEYCVAQIVNDFPATPGAPPIPVRTGFDHLGSVEFHDSPSSPYQTIDNQLEQDLDGESVYETLVFNENHDLDGDTIADFFDNCPFVANFDQLDRGGFEGENGPDEIGDLCQCGDVNGTGAVLATESGSPTSDLQMMREYLVGMHASDEHIPSVCSVHGNSDCDTADAVVLDRALRLPGVAIESRCEAAVD